jgi:serine/threonine protein phosphatase PrpC
MFEIKMLKILKEKKAKIDFVDNIIKKEQENGKFDNNTVIEDSKITFGP